MVVRQNLVAENAMRYNNINTKSLSKKMEKLSSGYKINRAGDNAAGLAVSEKMRAQAAGLTQAVKNAEDGISMIQTFEGALNETHKILNRIKTLATQSANGIYSDETDRAAIELEYEQLIIEIDEIAATDYNGITILNGSKYWKATVMDTIDLYPRRSSTPEDEKKFQLIQKMGGGANIYSSLVAGEREPYLEFGENWLSQGITMFDRENVAWGVIYVDASDYETLQSNLSSKNYILKGSKDPEIVHSGLIYDDYIYPSRGIADLSVQAGARTKDLKSFTLGYSEIWNFSGADAAAIETAKHNAIGDLNADFILTAGGLGLNIYTYAGAHADSADKMAMVNLSTQERANASLDTIDYAVNKVSLARAKLGSVQNRLEHKIDNLSVTNENITASESRIRDTNIADEVKELSKAKIIAQASQAMLAQANQLPSSVLSLLQ